MRTEDELRDAMGVASLDVRDRRLPALLMAAIVVVLVVAIGSVALLSHGHDDAASAGPQPTSVPAGTSVPTSVASRSVPLGWRPERGGGVVVHYPSTWAVTRYTGGPAPEVFPLFYLSEHRLGRKCPGDSGGPVRPTAGTTGCFDGTFTVPADGLVVNVREIEFPGPADYQRQPGRKTVVDGRSAKVFTGTPRTCGSGATSEISAAVEASKNPKTVRYESDYYSVAACLGPRVPTSERAAVYTMIATMQVTG